MRFVHVETHHLAEEITWQLLCARPAEANISHKGLPTREEHARYLKRHPYRAWYLIFNREEQCVGALSLTYANEIGIAILPEHQRKGYAREAIKQIIRTFPPLPAVPGKVAQGYVANINPANKASIDLFTSLGGVHIQNTYRLPSP